MADGGGLLLLNLPIEILQHVALQLFSCHSLLNLSKCCSYLYISLWNSESFMKLYLAEHKRLLYLQDSNYSFGFDEEVAECYDLRKLMISSSDPKIQAAPIQVGQNGDVLQSLIQRVLRARCKPDWGFTTG